MSDAAVLTADAHGGHAASDVDRAEAMNRSKLGMWLFLASEVMFFSGFIAAYIVLRMGGDPAVFDGSILNWKLAALNTVLLLTSSLTMVLAIVSIQRGDQKGLQLNLFFTILLGFGFLVVKSIEYGTKFLHHITPASNVFMSCYFVMTGFHGIHVIGGIIVLSFLLVWSIQGKYSATNYTSIEITGLYWHLVDIVWIFLFPLLYLM